MKDAIRHSYWTALCASQVLCNETAARKVTTAHEWNNRYGYDKVGNVVARQHAFLSTMDLKNNSIGLTVKFSLWSGDPDSARILPDLWAKYQQGLMWIWDGKSSEVLSTGKILKSNGEKVWGL